MEMITRWPRPPSSPSPVQQFLDNARPVLIEALRRADGTFEALTSAFVERIATLSQHAPRARAAPRNETEAHIRKILGTDQAEPIDEPAREAIATLKLLTKPKAAPSPGLTAEERHIKRVLGTE